MKKDWDRFFKKMLLNSTYGVSVTPEMIDEVRKIVQNEMKIQKRDEKIDKLLE